MSEDINRGSDTCDALPHGTEEVASMQDKSTTPDLVKLEPGIYRRSNGKLKIGWRDSGGRQRWRTLPRDCGVMAARSALREEIGRRERGEKIPDNPRITFSQVADEWMETKVSRLRPNSQNAYRAHLRHLNAYFGGYKLVDIDVGLIVSYVSKKEREGLKGWTVRKHLTVLSAVFTYAARYKNFTAKSPVSLLDKYEQPADDAAEKRALNHAELRTLCNAIPEAYRLVVTLAAQTGMRLSEVLGLRWEDFDEHEMTVTISGQLDLKGNRAPAKTRRSNRTLEITPTLTSQLSTLPRRSEFIFTSPRGTLGQSHVGRIVRKAAIKAGLGPVTFHELRHSHASALIADGWDAQQVADRLGDSIVTVLSTYSHAFDSAKRGPIRRDRLASIYDFGSIPEAHTGSSSLPQAVGGSAEVVSLQAIRNSRQ